MQTRTRYRVLVLEPLDLVIGRSIIFIVQQLLREAPGLVQHFLQALVLLLHEVFPLTDCLF